MSAEQSRRERAAAAFTRRFGVDARTLAAFRVALATVLLADLALRTRHLHAFYTDSGVLPRSALAEQFPALARVSLHAVSGAAWVQVVLFVAAAVAALALLVGYRTRAATVVSWLLLVSLHARNPVVLSAGDSILRRLLLWGLFLPLGARWSVDTRRTDGDPFDRVTSVATAALLLQVVAVYVVNGLLKLRGDAWLAGDAIRYVFQTEAYALPLADALAGHSGLLAALSHGWLVLLVASPLLVAFTGRARVLAVATFAAAHVGMAATMRLGLFPLVSLVALVPFLPGRVWDRVPTHGWTPAAAFDRALPRLPRPRIPPGVATAARTAGTVVVACLLVVLVAWNAAALGYVDAPESGTVSPQEHRWDMFAPEPRHATVTYDVTGKLAAGSRVDVADGGLGGVRWRTYLFSVEQYESELQAAFGEFLCDRGREANATLQTVDVTYEKRIVELDAPDATTTTQFAAVCGATGKVDGERGG